MKPKTFMLIAGETSGDLFAAELVSALRAKLPEAKFFGAGGAKMAAAGVELAFDMKSKDKFRDSSRRLLRKR